MKYTIAIVENDEDERFFMEEAFNKSGLFDIVAQLENGDALFNFLETNPDTCPQVILSDLNMPGKNGFDIIAGIKANPKLCHIPVIITSTSSTPTMIEKSRNLGAAEYLIKPDSFIHYEPFIKTLHKLIEEKQLVK
ncbi:MAG TPA: response regulator [Bacteroidia bacterium]|nr:response regulator [Bacteroidia bacterium]